MPTEIEDGLIEFTNGVRLHAKAIRELLGQHSYRRIAEIIGVSYIEYNEARMMCEGENFDPDDDLGTPPNDPPDLPQGHPSNQPKPRYRPADK